MNSRFSLFRGLLIAIVFFVSGLVSYKYITKPIADEANETKNWPTVEGTITYSDINSTTKDGKTMYSPSVRYKYTVDSKEFYGTKVQSVHSSTSSKNSVKKTLDKYAVGNTADVYYDPETPGSSVLEPGTGFVLGLILKLPLLFCILSVLIVLKMIKRLLLG